MKNKRKRIVFHTHEFNLNEGGPCTKRMDSLATYLSENEYEVTIITGSHNKKNEIQKIDKKYKILYCPILALGKKKTIYRFIEHVSLSISSFIIGIFKLGKIDYLLTTSPPPLISLSGYFLSKAKGSKLIYDVRDIWPDVAIEMESFDRKSFYFKVFNFIAKFMYKHSDFITTVSPGKVSKIKKYCRQLQVTDKKVIYIPNGLDDQFIKSKINKKIIKKYDLDKKITICYIGNVGLAQDLDILLDAAKKINSDNYQFLIFGDGAKRKSLEDRIFNEDIKNVKCCGKIDYSNVYTVLNSSKISFISLKNNNMKDSIPTKIFDAIGAGCPVLLLASGDSCDIIDETKFGEHISDGKKLKETIKYMLDNNKKYTNQWKSSLQILKNKYMRSSIAKKFEMEVIKND